MTQIVSLQQAIEAVKSLLIALIQKRRIEQRRQEIATHAAQTLESLEGGTAKRGTLADFRSDLLDIKINYYCAKKIGRSLKIKSLRFVSRQKNFYLKAQLFFYENLDFNVIFY